MKFSMKKSRQKKHKRNTIYDTDRKQKEKEQSPKTRSITRFGPFDDDCKDRPHPHFVRYCLIYCSVYFSLFGDLIYFRECPFFWE